MNSITSDPLLARVLSSLPEHIPIYMVGGAVRDVLIGRAIHDYDFVMPAPVLPEARRLANIIGAAYYAMDVEHDTARLILKEGDDARIILDFTAMRGANLDEDLKARDFTINAMALDLRHPEALIDPLGGANDLHARRLRACSPSSFVDDPNRVLRALRLANQFSLRIIPETLAWMRQAVHLLPRVSIERIRDELFHILSGKQVASVARMMDMIGALPYVLPELASLKGVEQSAPHVYDVWEHTLEAISKLEDLLQALDVEYDADKASNLVVGLAVLRLGRYRQQIAAHLQTKFTPERSLRPLLFLALLYHDIAKPRTMQRQPSGRIRFFDHDRLGAEMVAEYARSIHLSNQECDRLKRIVGCHLRPVLLSQAEGMPTSRAVYRFFRDAGPAGVDVCLLSLADVAATYGVTLPQQHWLHHVDVTRNLLEGWWEKPQQSVSPPRLINGNDLINHFGMEPGPKIGKLLEALKEAQAAGDITTTEQALAFIQEHLAESVGPDQG